MTNLNTGEVSARSGVSFRRLDHWVRTGILRPGNAAPGSGRSRQWDSQELRVAEIMGALTAAGMLPPPAAAIAREAASAAEYRRPLGAGVTLTIRRVHGREVPLGWPPAGLSTAPGRAVDGQRGAA